MVFGPKRKLRTNEQIEVNISGQKLDVVTKTKFLGLILDNELSWKPHTLYIAQKMAKSVGILSRARKILTPPTLL